MYHVNFTLPNYITFHENVFSPAVFTEGISDDAREISDIRSLYGADGYLRTSGHWGYLVLGMLFNIFAVVQPAEIQGWATPLGGAQDDGIVPDGYVWWNKQRVQNWCITRSDHWNRKKLEFLYFIDFEFLQKF